MLPVTKKVQNLERKYAIGLRAASRLAPKPALAMWLCGIAVTASTWAAPASAGNAADVIKDIAGRRVNLADKSRKAMVLVFIARDCPISNNYAAEINRLGARYAPKGIGFCVVYPEAGLAAAQARQHASEFGYRFPAVLDPAHRLVKRTQVRVTPEVAVLAPNGKILYRGRIDDRYAALGKPRLKATRHDLSLALDAISAGKPIAMPRTTATGCYIEG